MKGESMFEAVKTVITENWQNRKRMFRLASYELKAQNNGTMFGFLWNFFNPALQILVYWFVFSIGLQQRAPYGQYPYIIWMIVGIIPWFYISTCLQSSAMSIYSYSGVLKRVYLPLAIVPIKTVISGFIGHLWAMLVVFAVMIFSRSSINPMVYQLPYYMFAMICFLAAWSLFASAVTVVFKDFQKILTPFIRLLFYISPIVWSQENLSDNLQAILSYNPFAYILQGYRNCILYGYSITVYWKMGLYFWTVTILLFLFGASVHMKFRKKFMDLI